MKLFKYFALALVGAMTAGCSSDDLATDAPQLPDAAGCTVTMKTTITLDERASTRALTEAGAKSFAAGDQIAVIYQNTSGETIKAVSDALTTDDIDATKAQSATFSVSLTNPKASTPVRYIYPAAMAVATIATDAAIDDASTIDYTKLATQDGTLTKLGSNFDLAVFDGEMTAQAVLPAATLENPLTIGKFTIKNSGGTDVTNTITKLTIGDGTNTYTVNRTAADGPIYVAMKPISNTQTVVVQATDGTTHYVKTVTDKTLAKNNITPVNVTMFARTPASNVAAADIGKLLGADGFIHADATAAAATGTTAVALITYVGSATAESSPYTHGLALALSDANGGNTCKWMTPSTDADHAKQTDTNNLTSESGLQYNDATHNTDTYPAFKAAMANNGTVPPTGCSAWFLPTAYQWNQMINACKNVLGTNGNGTDLRYGFNGVGGTDLQLVYWSSSESNYNYALDYSFNFNQFVVGLKSTGHYVRAALAF